MFSKQLFLVLCLNLALVAWSQETFTHTPSGLSFTLPAGWSYTQEGDHFEAASPGDEVILLFFVGKFYEVEAAINGAVDELANIVKNPNITTETTEAEINGLLQVFIEGDGLFEGEVMDWDLTLVQGSKKCMVVIALGDIDSNQRIMDGIYDSIHE